MSDQLSSEWSWRDVFFALTHRWYVFLALFLIGCGIGWIAAKLLPAPYRAEADLGVFYQSDAIFRNVDDYKNWEMGQLQALILSDQLLSLVQKRLSEQDPYWQTQTPADLRQRLHVYWRNAGVWHLVAEDAQPQRAAQLVEVWKAVILEEMERIAELTHQLKQVHTELQATAQAKVAAEQRLAELQAIAALLQSWKAEQDSNLSEQSVAPLQRWRMMEIALRLDQNRWGEHSLAASLPPEGAGGSEIQKWVEGALAAAEMQSNLLQANLPALEGKLSELTTRYNELAAASWYLSIYLGVDELNAEVKAPRPLRTESTAMLIGGSSTLLLGVLIGVASLQWRKERLANR